MPRSSKKTAQRSKTRHKEKEVTIKGFARPQVEQMIADMMPVGAVGGRFRVQLGERVDRFGNPNPRGRTKRIVGDSGWIDNTFTNHGRDAYIAAKIGSVSGSKTPTHLQIATQSTVVDATQTSLAGETRIRRTLVAATFATGTLRMTASWSSTDNTAAITIGSIAVYNTDTAGTMGSGQTYATSQWNSNQDLSATYEWRF
jgi:hypothetical protein